MVSNRDSFTSLNADEVRDLGFGDAVARNARKRLLNRDGTFNAGRRGLPLLRSVPVYEHLTRSAGASSISWHSSRTCPSTCCSPSSIWRWGQRR